eukprot:Gb_25716 [translate_table: standard]
MRSISVKSSPASNIKAPVQMWTVPRHREEGPRSAWDLGLGATSPYAVMIGVTWALIGNSQALGIGHMLVIFILERGERESSFVCECLRWGRFEDRFAIKQLGWTPLWQHLDFRIFC